MPSQRCPKISHRNTVVRSEILEGWTVALTVGIAEEIRDRWAAGVAKAGNLRRGVANVQSVTVSYRARNVSRSSVTSVSIQWLGYPSADLDTHQFRQVWTSTELMKNWLQTALHRTSCQTWRVVET